MSSIKKYILPATAASFVIPIATIVWSIFFADFRNPDGTPDNGPIRGAPFLVILMGFVFIFQLFAYGSLGSQLYKSLKPSLVPGVVHATYLSLPMPFFVLFAACPESQRDLAANFYALFMAAACFAYLWVCFMCGAVIQYWLIVRHNQAFNRTI